MNKEDKYSKKSAIMFDADMIGIGINRIVLDFTNVYFITFLGLVIYFTTQRFKRSQKTTAKYYSCGHVEVSPYDTTNKNILPYTLLFAPSRVDVRFSDNITRSVNKFYQINKDYWAIYNFKLSKWEIKESYDVFPVNRMVELEGFVHRGTFYVVKELSVG